MNAEIIKSLEKHKVKPTPMRMLVLELLMKQQQNLSLSEIEDLLYPSDRVTIYRTLQTFVKNGLAHSIEATGQAPVYAVCDAGCSSESHKDNHPHFFCEVCKQITCTNDFQVFVDKKNASQYQINSVETRISGICPKCIF